MSETACAGAPGGAVFDQQATLARVKGDREMLREVVQLFFAEAPELLARIPGSDYVRRWATCSAPRMPLKGTG